MLILRLLQELEKELPQSDGTVHSNGLRTAAILLKDSYLNDLTFTLQGLEKMPTVSSEFTQQIPPYFLADAR